MEEKLMENIPRIGSHVLSDEMLKQCFHHSDAILNNIAVIRSIAAEESPEFSSKLIDNPGDAVSVAHGYNNALSILGSRGTGKTSIILTLQEKIRNDIPEKIRNIHTDYSSTARNITLPIIIPADLPYGQTLLSRVITLFLEKAREVEKKASKKSNTSLLWDKWSSNNDTESIRNPFADCIRNLTNAYELRTRMESNVRATSEAYGEQAYYFLDSVHKDANLQLELFKLISMMCDYYRAINSNTFFACEDAEPLLFIIIDDIDLAPERSREVLEIVMKYLTHPNLVVLCGWNQELFLNNLCIDILRSQGLIQSGVIDAGFGFDDVFQERYRKRYSSLDSARRLAMDNLKKAFPTAQRYEIRGLIAEDRANFLYAINDKPAEATLFDLIFETISASSYNTKFEKKKCFLYDQTITSSESDKGTNEMIFKDHQLNIYARIFDNKARGLINISRAFSDLKIKIKQYISRKTNVCDLDNDDPVGLANEINNLVNTILFSNTCFAPYRRGIRDLIKIRKVKLIGDGKWELDYFFDFRTPLEKLEEYEKNRDELIANSSCQIDGIIQAELKYNYFPSIIIDVFLLMNFMENFLQSITGCASEVHGGKEFSRALNSINKPASVNDEYLNDLILDNMRFHNIENIVFFPYTSDPQIAVGLLNQYDKKKYLDGQYRFRGYSQIIQIFNSITHEIPIGSVNYNRVISEDREWLYQIASLYNSMLPNKENIRGLAAYRCLIVQGFYDFEYLFGSVARSIAQQPPTTAFENALDVANEQASDEELDTVIKFLRKLDTERRKLNDTKKKSDNDKKRKSKESTDADFICDNTKVFVSSVNQTATVQKNGDKDYITKLSSGSPLEICDILGYFSDYEMLSFSDMDNSDRLENTNELAKTISKLNNDIHCILLGLKNHFLAVIGSRFNTILDNYSKYKFLYNVSKVLNEYAAHWDLLGGSWSTAETKSITSIRLTLMQYGLTDLAEDASEIMKLGLSVATTSRNKYVLRVDSLLKGVKQRTKSFNNADFERMMNDFEILKNAPGHIRRATVIDENIINIMREIGEVIAGKCADLSVELYKKESTRVWIVNKKDEEEYREYEKKLPIFESSLRANSSTNKASRFDTIP